MKPLHEQEVEDAKQRVNAGGRSADDFGFSITFMEPDPDGGGMYTVRYDVTVTSGVTGKSESYIGGIGMDWVDAFEEDLKDGAFD